MANELDKMMQMYGLGAVPSSAIDPQVMQNAQNQQAFDLASPMANTTGDFFLNGGVLPNQSPMAFQASNAPSGSELENLIRHYGLNAASQSEFAGQAGNQADQDVYNQYVRDYQHRLKNTAMYGASPWADTLSYLQAPSRVFDFGLHPVTNPVDTSTTTPTDTSIGGSYPVYTGGLNGGIDLSTVPSSTTTPSDTLVSYPDTTTPFVPGNPQTLVNGQWVNTPTGSVQTGNLNNAINKAFDSSLNLSSVPKTDTTGITQAINAMQDPNYLPQTTQDSALADSLRAIASGVTSYAPNIEAGINSLTGNQTYDQSLAQIQNENKNFQIENPILAPALTAGAALGSFGISGSPIDLYNAGKTIYNALPDNAPTSNDVLISNAVKDAANSSNVLTPYLETINPTPPQKDVSQPTETPVTPFVDTAVNSWNNPSYVAPASTPEPAPAPAPTPTPAPEPNVNNDANYQMAFDMGLEKSYDPNFDYVNYFYNNSYADVYGNPYTSGYSGSNGWGESVFNSPWGSSFMYGSDFGSPSGGGWAGVGIEGMPEDTWSWTPWNPGGSQTYGMGWLFGQDWKEGGHIDFSSMEHKYAEGGEVNKLDQLVKKYQPRRFELGGQVDAENTDLPVIPQAKLNTRIEPSINDLNAKYPDNPLWQEYTAARQKARQENDLLRTALEKHLSDQPVDKSEMYFRLAAALASPTRTQGIGEPLARAAEAMAVSKTEERKDRQANALTALKARQGLAELAGTEAKDIGELYSKYAKGNAPLSSAGKQALDEGLIYGTPEYTQRVQEIGAQNQLVSPVSLANLGINQERLKLEQEKAHEASQERSRKASKLSPTELNMKASTQEQLNALQEMEQQLKRAYDLSDVSFDNSLPDLSQRKILETTGSSNDKLTNTLELEKILGGQTLAQGQQMKGTLSDSDIKLLSGLSGASSKSKTGRDAIIRDSIAAIRRGMDKTKKKLSDIQSGAYSTYEEAQ